MSMLAGLAAIGHTARTALHLIGVLAIIVIALVALAAYALAQAPILRSRPLRPLALSTSQSTDSPADIEHQGLASSLRALLDLVKIHYILPWYTRLSPSPVFPDSVDNLVRSVLYNAYTNGSGVDWPDLVVSRIVPLVRAHLAHFQRVQHLAGQLPLPLPKDAHPAFANQAAAIEVHLRDVMGRVVRAVLPEADRTLIVRTLAREICLGIVLPVFDMLAEGDFWNQQIDEKGERYLHER